MKKLNNKLNSSHKTPNINKVVYSVTGFLLLTTIFAGIVLSSSSTNADTVTSSVSVNVNVACTITTGGGEYSETIDPNTSKTIVGNGINVSCNDSGGYALYAIGFSGDSYDTPNNNRMLGPNSQYIPTANSGSDSYWAMKAAGSSTTSNVPTIDNSYSDFQIIPATYTKISHYSSVTVGTTDNSVTTPTYKVNVSAAQPVGTYVGKVKYVLVHPSSVIAGNYTIAYNSNGGTGTMSSDTNLTNFEDHTIKANTFTRDGYEFAGWCTSNTPATLDDCTGSTGTAYTDQATIPAYTVSADSTLTLYAYWNVEVKTYMQDMTAEDCTTTAKKVYDNRDEESYLVQRLADGKCWILDNLRLDLGNSTVLNNTTESNTNASTTTLNYLKNGGGSTSDRYPTAKINNVPWTSSSQNYYSIPMTISTYKDQTTTSYGEGSGKIGIYYNYCAASAGNYCFGNGTSSGSPSGNATEDICPKGWRMPTGGSSGEYQALYTAYSSDQATFKNALSTPLSGFFENGSANEHGSTGRFWSSTRNSSYGMYYLYLNSSSVQPTNYHNRYRGYSVRCVLGS